MTSLLAHRHQHLVNVFSRQIFINMSTKMSYKPNVPYFASVLANTPEATHWKSIRQWLDKYPIEIGDYLRNHQPIMVTKSCVLLSKFKDIIEALDQPKVFTVELYRPKMGSYLMTEDDTPRHNEDKAIMVELLSQENLSEVRMFVAKASRDLLKNQQSMNLVEKYSKLVPALMVQNVFGLDGIAARKLIGFSYWNQYSTFRNQAIHPEGVQSNVELRKLLSNIHMGFYLALLLIRKRWKILTGKPDNDTVTRLIQQQFSGHGSPRFFRKAINTGGLLIGAIETTSEAVIHVLQVLSEQPKLFERARTLARLHSSREAFENICWEALRHKPIAPYIMRKLATDYVFTDNNGRQIKLEAGSIVLCLISAAMFDEDGFSNPSTFKADRKFGQSFHFGYGHHACLGHAFGRILIPEMLRQLFRKPGFRVAGNIEYRGQPFPAHLPVAWDETLKATSTAPKATEGVPA